MGRVEKRELFFKQPQDNFTHQRFSEDASQTDPSGAFPASVLYSYKHVMGGSLAELVDY